jgi:Ca-activated chloride channel homolog
MRPSMSVPDLNIIKSMKPSVFLNLGWIVPLLKYTALTLLIVAVARPQLGTRHISVLTKGINIVLALDVSESMGALDFKKHGEIVNRLEAVKGVINDFTKKRTHDRIGLVIFGTHAYTQVPMTRDYNTISTILERVKIGAAGKSTAIGDAIGISLKRLRDLKSASNVIILLTDGRNNAGELTPEITTDIAAERNVKIYTVGVGTKGRAPFPVNHPIFGKQYIYQQVDIDEDTLKNIAEKTGGMYFRAEHTKQLEEIYAQIDAMEKTEVKTKIFAEYKDLYIYFLVPAFLLLVLWIIISNTRYLRIP